MAKGGKDGEPGKTVRDVAFRKAPRSAASTAKAKRPPRNAPVTPDVPSTERIRRLYLTGLGAVLFVAFWSLWGQVDGLIGPTGILPADVYLEQVDAALVSQGLMADPSEVASSWTQAVKASAQRTWVRTTHLPTLGWWLPAGSAGLLCALGIIASVVVMSGRLVAPALLVSWALYLSLSGLGQRFLGFQWDTLLTEVTFASLLVAPWGLRARHAAYAPGWWLLRTILFRLVFFGGLVKLTSGDPTWRDLSALTFHYETQPLPNGLSWLAHQPPWWLHAASALVMFAVELVVVWGVFGTRTMRRVAAASVAALMVALAVTGNYGFFQLLTIVLCLSCLDDEDLGWLNRVWKPGPVMPPLAKAGRWAVGTGATVLLAVALLGVGPRYADVALPKPLERVRQAVAPWRTVNHYGLFATMTTSRPLPVLEAKWGDQDWTELTWLYQSSDPAAPPTQVAPYMPRLDWQLWFAGLGSCERNRWVRNLGQRVLDGDRAVAGLIGDLRLLTSAPPDAVRFALVDYRFAPPGTPDGPWWVRERKGLYCGEMHR